MNKLILFVYFQFFLFSNFSCNQFEQPQNLNTILKYNQQPNVFELKNFHFQTNKSTKTLKFHIRNTNVTIQNSFLKGDNFQIYNFTGGTSLKVVQSRWRPKDGAIEYQFVLKNRANRSDDEICFHYGEKNVYWYSTYIENRTPAEWPLNPHHNIDQPFTTSGHIPMIENLFLNTNGFALILDSEHSWSIHRWQDDSNQYLCFGTSIQNSNEFQIPDHFSEYYSVKFYVLIGRSIRDVHKSLIRDFGHIKLNPNPPERIVFQEPIFSTESLRYLGNLIHDGVNQRHVEDLARNISGSTQFNGAQIQIDEWRDRAQALAFNSKNYQIPNLMTAKLHTIGHQIGLRIAPTIFDDIQIDFTDPEEVDYFVDQWNRLKSDQNMTIDSLIVQFCSADSFSWASVDETIRKYPNFISTLCAQAFMRTNLRISIDSAYKAQSLSNLLIRNQIEYGDQELRRMLINSLILSLAGYQFFQPQLIHSSALPPLEWYLRWLQAVTFLPVMHIPVPPWAYGDRSPAIGLTRKFVKLHQTLVNWERLSRRWLKFGEPMIRPMWYAEPGDSRSYRVDDQFMVGDRLVVAPILMLGQYNRTVYLPTGKWKGFDNREFSGPNTFVMNAPRDALLYFVKIRV